MEEGRRILHPLQPITPSNDGDIEANLPQLLSIQKHPSIEDESGLVHAIVNRSPVNFAELLPLRRNHNSLGICTGREGVAVDSHPLLD